MNNLQPAFCWLDSSFQPPYNKDMKKKSVHISRAVRSFLPIKDKTPTVLRFRGAGHMYVGADEPAWPSADVQAAWNKRQLNDKISESFQWYSATQNAKTGRNLAIATLALSGHRPKLIKVIKQSSAPFPHTVSWLIRMAHMGMVLRFEQKRLIATELRECVSKQKSAAPADAPTNKPTIQDHLSAKVRRVKGEIDEAFDKFILSGYKETSRPIINILADPVIGAPSNKVRDLLAYADKYLAEYKLALSGRDEQVTEAYASVGRRGIKASIAWWEQAITDINTFGQLKKDSRKSRKRREIPAGKILAKLKFARECKELGLTSIDPTQILRCSSLWVYNPRLRKLGHYVSLNGVEFQIKNTRITNIDTVKSVQKTLRKPVEQLKEFNNYGKPGAVKWFDKIRAVATRMRSAVNSESILLRAEK